MDLESLKLNLPKKRINSEIFLDKKSFNTDNFETSIGLLSTHEYNVLLKAVGTLARCASQQEEYASQFINLGIYVKLVNLLEYEDTVILKYTCKLLAIYAKPNFLKMLQFDKVLMCSELINRFYIETDDDFLKECTSFILWQYCKYSEVISNQIYSPSLIQTIFSELYKAADIDILWNSLNLFHYLLDVEPDKENILENASFSLKTLKCLLQSDLENVRNLTTDIILKLTKWRSERMNTMILDYGFINIMVNMLIKDDKEFIDRAFKIMENCLAHDVCALKFSKSEEFKEYIAWLRSCPNKCILSSLPILEILSKAPDIKQKLYDMNFEQILLFWLKYQHTELVLYLLKIIDNMSEHKTCAKVFCKFAVIDTIKNYINADLEPMQPHNEQALLTLKNLVVRIPEALNLFILANGIPLVSNLFINGNENMSEKEYLCVVKLLRLILSSKYAESMFSEAIFDKIFDLYSNVVDMKLEMMTLINILGRYEVFRNYILENDKIDEMVATLKREQTVFGTQYHLEILANLVKYRYIAYKLLDLDFLQFLKEIKPKLNLTLIQDIINDLHDHCLTLKFYETGRLSVHDRLDDRFYLIQEELPPETISKLAFGITPKPVYVVSVQLLKITKESDKNATKVSHSTAAFDSIDALEGKRILSTGLVFSNASLTLTAMYQRSKIPENILLYRRTSFYSGRKNSFYEDSYLERYILSLMRDLYFSDDAPTTLVGRIEYVAKYIARQLSGIFIGMKDEEKKRAFEEHIQSLRRSVGMNVIPIGYLRMGNHCERALLFKALCDNLYIPTTLNRGKDDIYWNEVRCILDEDQRRARRMQETPRYIVDLMKNVGKLVPIDSLEAKEYLTPFRKK
ncbi:hypothetical protein Trydic_g21339 [Trypoxylus dichotomus]